MNASTRLSMNGKSPMISTALPFVAEDERRIFQQNRLAVPLELFTDGEIS